MTPPAVVFVARGRRDAPRVPDAMSLAEPEVATADKPVIVDAA
jgi:hypothetical protein